jgi:hypothetical protein
MADSKQMKTGKLGIVLQVTEVTGQGAAGRRWVVHDVERNRGFKVELSVPTMNAGATGGKSPRWTEADVEGALGIAIERFLLASPELVAGPLYDVQVTSNDLDEYKHLAR